MGNDFYSCRQRTRMFPQHTQIWESVTGGWPAGVRAEDRVDRGVGVPTPGCAAAASSSRSAAAGCTLLPHPLEPPALIPPAPAPASGLPVAPVSPRPQSTARILLEAARPGARAPPLAVDRGYHSGARSQAAPTFPPLTYHPPATQPGRSQTLTLEPRLRPLIHAALPYLYPKIHTHHSTPNLFTLRFESKPYLKG